jgi:Ca2+/H+ antiporter
MMDVKAANPKLKGIGGWLLLLCLNLAVFDPVAVLLNLFMATDSTGNDFTHHPELLRLSLIGGIPRIGLMVFSLYAGLSLWKRAPGAVAVARKYLICLFFFSIFSLFLPPMVGVTENLYPGTSAMNDLNVMITMVWVAVWYFYLVRSKRVKATYIDGSTDAGEG